MGLSAYERQRNANIKANEAALASLGLLSTIGKAIRADEPRRRMPGSQRTARKKSRRRAVPAQQRRDMSARARFLTAREEQEREEAAQREAEAEAERERQRKLRHAKEVRKPCQQTSTPDAAKLLRAAHFCGLVKLQIMYLYHMFTCRRSALLKGRRSSGGKRLHKDEQKSNGQSLRSTDDWQRRRRPSALRRSAQHWCVHSDGKKRAHCVTARRECCQIQTLQRLWQASETPLRLFPESLQCSQEQVTAARLRPSGPRLDGVLVWTTAGRCATPGCTLKDFHAGEPLAKSLSQAQF